MKPPCNCEQALTLEEELKAKRALETWASKTGHGFTVAHGRVIIRVRHHAVDVPGSSVTDRLNKAAHIILSDPELESVHPVAVYSELPFK
jgi:hypothetical protein